MQFDICRLIGAKGMQAYVVVLQHERFTNLKTRVVAPLLPVKAGPPLAKINPIIPLANEKWMVAFDQMATVDIGRLSAPVGSAKDRHSDFIAAIDMMFMGY